MDILAARGLDVELADRLGFASARRGDGSALVIPFVREGKIVRRKYRRFDREEGRWSQDPGGPKAAWNEDCLRREDLIGQPLVITEGEFDAFAAIQSGFERTISVPDGAPPPGDRSAEDLAASRKYDWLRELSPLLHKDRVGEIILAVDGDENGAALLQDLSVQLGRYRCKFLTYPKARDAERLGRPRCKDLNEVLVDYGQKGVVETLTRAQWLKVDGVFRMSELPPLPPSVIYDIGFPALGEHYKLRLGDFAVWTGIPSHGKTSAVQDVVCRVCATHGLKAAWASFEQTPQRDHKRAFKRWYWGDDGDGLPVLDGLLSRAQIEEAERWIDEHHVFLVPGEDDEVNLEWLLEKAEVAIVRHGCRIVVVDPWNEMDHLWERHETEAQYINRAIKTLRRFARAFQVHLILVAHPTKQLKGADGTFAMPSLYDINGGAVWYNKADLGVIVHREDEINTKIKVAKSRYHDIIGKPGSVRMHYSLESRRYTEQERIA